MKRKKNQGNSTLIVLLVIIVLIVGAVAAVLIIRHNRKYTTGEVDGQTYTNKWAKVKVTVPDDYIIDTKNQKTDGFDVPFAFASKDGKSYCYVFTRECKPDMSNTEEEFRKMFGDGKFNVSYGKIGMQMNFSTDHRTIAGESYDCLVFSGAGARIVVAFRAVYDNGVFCICTATMNGVYEDDLFKMFEKN